MIEAIIFSKNRPAQLDLLLRSIEARAPQLFKPPTVLYTSNAPEYKRGYKLCEKQHNKVYFIEQQDFQQQVLYMLNNGAREEIMFLCDDDLFIRPFIDAPNPTYILKMNQDVLCVSLRLGRNTVECYPLRRIQKPPEIMMGIKDARYWNWTDSDADWGYPGSLDGNIFRRETLRAILAEAEFSNPNSFEDQLQYATLKLKSVYPLMACYENSLLTGVPVNIVNQTHGNRNGEIHPRDPMDLNYRYLKGERLTLGSFSKRQVTGAHTELALEFA